MNEFLTKIENVSNHINGSPFSVVGFLTNEGKIGYYYRVFKKSDNPTISIHLSTGDYDNMEIAIDSLQFDIENPMFEWIESLITTYFETKDSDLLSELDYLFLQEWQVGYLQSLLFNDFISDLEYFNIAIETIEIFETEEEMITALKSKNRDFIEGCILDCYELKDN